MAKLSLLDQLKKLSATTFEQLAFDLVMSVGLRNAVWRTPGADGGRDIEGDYVSVDMTGAVGLQKWYVECKRYQNTVDWPTVFPKLAYAQNRDADFLLLITTALLSPQCKSEIALHESKRRSPAIRVWDATMLGNTISTYPALLVKYGLSAPGKQVIGAFLPLSLAVARAVQASYGAASGGAISAPLEFAAAASELLWIRAKEATNEIHPFHAPLDLGSDLYPWLTVSPATDLSTFDRFGLRAMLSGIRYVTGAAQIAASTSPSHPKTKIVLSLIKPSWSLSDSAAQTLIGDVSFWANTTIHVQADGSLILEKTDAQ